MKMKVAGILISSLILSASLSVSASQVYYTFDGTISYFSSENYAASDFGIIVGETPVRYIFEIDFNREGFISEGGFTNNYPDTDDRVYSKIDNFYVNLLSGSILNLTYHGVTFNHGMNQDYYFNQESQGALDTGMISGGSGVMIYRLGDPNWKVDEWINQPNDILFIEQAKDSWDSAPDPYLKGTVSLTSISNVNPVPLPPAMLLFVFGLTSIIGISLKCKVKRLLQC